MNTLLSPVYNFLALLAYATGCHKLMLSFVKKMLEKTPHPFDTTTWISTIVDLPSTVYKKHPTVITSVLKGLAQNMDQNSPRFSYLLLGLGEHEAKHPVLFDVLPHTSQSTQSQTFFLSCFLHNQKVRSLEPSVQNNLYISLLSLLDVDFATDLNHTNQQLESQASMFTFPNDDKIVYNLFICLARRAPPETLCFALSKMPSIPLEYPCLFSLPQDKKVMHSLVKHHPSFMFNMLSRYSTHPHWNSTPLIPFEQERLLEKSFPHLHQSYMEEARCFVAQKERKLILKNLKNKPSSRPAKTFKM